MKLVGGEGQFPVFSFHRGPDGTSEVGRGSFQFPASIRVLPGVVGNRRKEKSFSGGDN